MAVFDIIMLIYVVLSVIAEVIVLILLGHNLHKYKYVGHNYILAGIIAGFCFLASLIVNFSKANLPAGIPAAFGLSVFDTFKMVVVAFEKETIVDFFSDGNWVHYVFGVAYIVSSIVTFVLISISTILSVYTICSNGFKSFKKQHAEGSNIHYIFTDANVGVSVRLAEELNKDNAGETKNSVTVFVTRASLKTQEGTEFRDALIGKGIHVQAENFTKNLADKIIKKYLPKFCKGKFDKNVYIYCMFSDDNTSTQVANNFEVSIKENQDFINFQNRDKNGFKKEELDRFERFKIFITYQDNDIDLIHNYSQNTLHIINTLSQYDMVSSEFMLENPITNFIDLKKITTKKDNQCMHVTFLGLGMINRPIFEKMTHAYQLWGDNINKVNYHILDREASDKALNCQNMYTDPKGKLFLYNVEPACEGEDLFEYEVIDRYIKSIKDESNRFNDEGFELFIISLKNTNSDLKVAKNLKRALLKYINESKDSEENKDKVKKTLKKTVIFLRIGEEEVASRLEKTMQGDFISQKNLDILNPEYQGRAPLVAYGENALMPKFISSHYTNLIKTGIVSSYAYHVQDKETFSTSEDDSEYLRIRRDWLDNDKYAFVKNVVVTFGLDTKKSILGCQNLDDVKAIFADTKENPYKKRYTTYNIEKDKLIQIASLEHNRWLAATYFMDRCMPLDDVVEGEKAFENLVNNNYSRKIDGNTKHVCMLTNADLKKLYNFYKEKGKEEEGFKVVFLNDIKPIQKYFEIIYSNNK